MPKVKITLDAGHYGNYNRSPAVSNYYEGIMTWKLHLLLKSELESYGFEVATTRANKNVDKLVYDRGTSSKGSNLLLSLHSNACDTESVDRPVSIYLVDDKNSTIDEESKAIAGKLSSMVAQIMQTQPAQTLSRLAGVDLNGDGLLNDDYYGVLRGAHHVGTPAVILEHSFHTNVRAAKWLLDDNNLAKLAKGEAEVLAKHFGMTKVATTPKKYYRVQVGAYANKANAEKTQAALIKAGFPAIIV